MEAITKTDFSFPGQVSKYVGKVRDVYDINNEYSDKTMMNSIMCLLH